MGTFTNIIVFSVVFSFFLFMFTVNSGTASNVAGSNWQTYIMAIVSGSNLGLWIMAAAGFAMLSGMLFPNPYTTFAGALGFLVGLVGMVSNVFGQFQSMYGLDSNVFFFIQVVYGIIMGFALLDWYRTGGSL